MDPASLPPVLNETPNRFHFSFPPIPFALKLIGIIILIGGIALFSIMKLLPYFAKSGQVKNEKFSLTQSYPSDQSSQVSLVTQPTFVFSKKIAISEKELSTYFHISPNVEGSWHIEKNQQVIYFSSDKKEPTSLHETFAYDTIYTITIDKILSAKNGEMLPDAQSITFRTIKNPQFTLVSDWKLLSAFANKPITIPFLLTSFDIKPTPKDPATSSAKITVFEASIDQFLLYLNFKKDKYPLYIPPPTKSMKVSYTTEKVLQQGELSIDIPSLKAGLYYITVENHYGKEDLFVTVSSHIHQVLFDMRMHTFGQLTQKRDHISKM
jgi:hypothetical protein